MKLLEDVAVPGERFAVCENRGSGIGAMVAALRQAGMTPPVFEDRVATFRVTFPNQTLLDDATIGWLNGVTGDLTDSQRRMTTGLRITLPLLAGLPGLRRAACEALVALQPSTVAEALAISDVGRRTTKHLLGAGLISDPNGLQLGSLANRARSRRCRSAPGSSS